MELRGSNSRSPCKPRLRDSSISQPITTGGHTERHDDQAFPVKRKALAEGINEGLPNFGVEKLSASLKLALGVLGRLPCALESDLLPFFDPSITSQELCGFENGSQLRI